MNVEDCVWNSILLHSNKWIGTDCNKDLIYGKQFWYQLLLLLSLSLISTNRYVSFLRYGVNKTPYSSGTLRRILLVCFKIAFYNSVIFFSIPMVFNLFSRALTGVPRAPTTNGTTVIFIFHTFFSSLTRSKYFWIFSTSL